MSFVTIIASRFAVGKALVKLLFTDIVGNLDDLDSRVVVVEAGANKIEVYNDLVLVRGSSASLTGLSVWQAISSFTLLDAKVSIFEKGSATGTLEFDILKGTDNDITGATTVFTTKPIITLAGASDFDENTGTLDVAKTSVATGNRLFLSITQLPTGLGKFKIFLIGEFN